MYILKYGIGFSQFTNTKNIHKHFSKKKKKKHKHEEHTPKKLILNKSIKCNPTDYM